MLDFLPDKDKLFAPTGATADLPDSDVLKFILVKRNGTDLTEPWSIPDHREFEKIINDITQRSLQDLAIDAFAWADPKRGNLAFHTHSCGAKEAFPKLIRE